ncbi:RabGAP/TBC [Cantharellus anzutake]|uniref:RabGAP/TBC n=1 Tax=Cantharellus anzutake TaxID=1750568 RepID=UPI001906B9F7|nr:RabGAP/TBC [Cantharellus anzutake]KAF8332648.1 RabGAP/TBC [Cantharellus anzutake]
MIGQKSPRSSILDEEPSRTQLPANREEPGRSSVPFLIARLDQQKERLGLDTRAQRASIDGYLRLKEDFQKLQEREQQLPRDDPEAEIDWDFWGAVMADYEAMARNEPTRLAKAIESGIPNAIRGMVWQNMSASKDAELEQLYSTFLKESSPHEKAIMRDLGRTFPHHAFFMDGKGIGQENLFNVLKAYSLYDPEVGYCQGLAFIVAILLLNMPDEEAFCVFVRLMQSYNLRSIYLPEMPGLQLRLYQFDRLVEELVPVLYVHFLRQGVKSSMYCSQWYLTMFSYRFPLQVVFRIFDHLFATGIEAIFGFSIVLLQSNEEKLLQLKFDSILDFLKNALFDAYLVRMSVLLHVTQRSTLRVSKDSPVHYRADLFIQDAMRVKVTPFLLDTFASEWEELRRAQNAHTMELESLRAANRSLTERVKALESSLAQMSEDHVDIVKQLVMAKVEKEDTEAELVKYKMLYAEQMHANEDANSTSNRISAMSRLSSWSSFSRK